MRCEGGRSRVQEMSNKRKNPARPEPPMCGMPISADYWSGKPIKLPKPYRLRLPPAAPAKK